MSELLSEIEALRSDGLEAVRTAESLDALEELDVRLLGRKSRLTSILRGMKDLTADDKRVVGPAANELRTLLEGAVAERRTALEHEAEAALLRSDRVDLTLPGRAPARGAPNPLRIVVETLEDVFIGLGYTVAEGPEIDTDWNNFEALNFPQDHASRSMMDTFYVKGPKAEDQALLRTHTSPVQIRVMTQQQPPIYVVCPGRTHRRDNADATHSPIFHQIEGLAVDEGLSMADLKGTLEAFAVGAFGAGRRIRLNPSFFPFTEPSCELYVDCPLCAGAGCGACSSGWLEVGGAGMVDPNVLENCGIDSERYTGFAFGMGIERIAMLRYDVDDLRLFFEADHRFLEQFRGGPAGA